MAQSSQSGAAPWLAFLIGGLVVLVLAVAWFAYSAGGLSGPSKSVDIDIKPPALPEGPKLPDAPLPMPK